MPPNDTLRQLLGVPGKNTNTSSTEDVLERPPVPGITYRAFIVSLIPGAPNYALAIGHAAADGRIVIDLARDNLICFETSTLLWTYKIDAVTTVDSDAPETAKLHAMAGVISLLQLEAMP